MHGRPAAFEGSDGFSYSVEIMTDADGRPERAVGRFISVRANGRASARRRRGTSRDATTSPRRITEDDARAIVGALSLGEVRALLDGSSPSATGGAPTRRWWDAMRDEDDGDCRRANDDRTRDVVASA